MLLRISSASLVQLNGRGRSFQRSMKAPIAAVSSLEKQGDVSKFMALFTPKGRS